MATLIDGKGIAKTIRDEIKKEIEDFSDKKVSRKPCLAVVIVGERRDSQTYVRFKVKACKEVGIISIKKELKDTITEEELVAEVKKLNEDETVDGILVQLPLPKHINEERILKLVSLKKDVDGFHEVNIGKLCMKGREPDFCPCTPKGCIELLDRMKLEISGKRAVVIGRSNIVGIPVAMLLMHRNATVTIVHSRTKDIPSIVKEADILVAALGSPNFVKKEWLKKGCVVIDVGINSVDDKTRKRGYRLVGDCDFEGCKEVAGYITPVPGGCGPMTIAMLLRNTVDGFKKTMKLN